MNGAQAELKKAHGDQPQLCRGHLTISAALICKRGKVDEALAEYRKSLAINPDSAASHFNLGYAYFLKGRVDEAIAEYRKGLAPSNPVLPKSITPRKCAFAKEAVGRSSGRVSTALKIDPSSAGPGNLGIALSQLGGMGDGIAAFPGGDPAEAGYADAEKSLEKARRK